MTKSYLNISHYLNENDFIDKLIKQAKDEDFVKKNYSNTFERIQRKFIENLKTSEEINSHTIKINKILALKEEQFYEELEILVKQIFKLDKLGFALTTLSGNRGFIFKKKTDLSIGEGFPIDNLLGNRILNIIKDNIEKFSYNLDFHFIYSNIDLDSFKNLSMEEYSTVLRNYFQPFNVVSNDESLIFDPIQANYVSDRVSSFLIKKEIGMLPSEIKIIKEIKEHFKDFEKSQGNTTLKINSDLNYNNILRCFVDNFKDIKENYSSLFSERYPFIYSAEQIRTNDDVIYSKLFKSFYLDLLNIDFKDIYITSYIDKITKFLEDSLTQQNVSQIKECYKLIYNFNQYSYDSYERIFPDNIIPKLFNKHFDYINENKEASLQFLAKEFNEKTASTFTEGISVSNKALWTFNYQYYNKQFNYFNKLLSAIQKESNNQIIFQKVEDIVFVIKNNNLTYTPEDLLNFIIESATTESSNLSSSWKEFELACKFDEQKFNSIEEKSIKSSKKKI